MTVPTSKKSQILLTGFGPFPGMPKNPSTTLAFELADVAGSKWPEHTFVAHSFATKWTSAEPGLTKLYENHNPDLVLHFGMGNQKSALHIERSARNYASGDEDAVGCCGGKGPILRDTPTRLKSDLPHYSALRELHAAGINTHLSNNAGSYLCNFLYYNSLIKAQQQQRPPIVTFIHLPTSICAPNPQRSPSGAVNDTRHLNWTELTNAGMILISHGLNKARRGA